MKTHIIPLEPHDDAYSVRDRMAWGKSARILLVWPEKGGRVLDRRLDLLLVKRRADELGSQLAVVTRDPEVRGHAGDLAVPVFQSISQAQTSRWLRMRGDAPDPQVVPDAIRTDPRGSRPVRRSGGGGGLAGRLAALAAGAAAFLSLGAAVLPSAEIRLQPEVRTQVVRFTAVTGPSITAAGATGSVPAAALLVTVEGSHSTETSGSILVPSEAAGGEVVFTNLTAEPVAIPAGTVVITGGEPPERFLVTAAGTAPAGPGEAITLTVSALLPGSAGNAPAGAVIAVEGLLGLQLTAANPSALTGGADVRLAAPNDEDRSRAAAELLETLRETAAAELSAQVGAGDVVLSAAPEMVAIEQETYLPAGTAPSDFVEVTLRVQFRLLAVRRLDLESLARTVLDASLEPGFRPVDDLVTLEFLGDPAAGEDGSAAWEMEVARTLRADPQPERLVFELLGKRPGPAGAFLDSTLDLAEPPVITINPSWWPWLPLLPVQIQFSYAP